MFVDLTPAGVVRVRGKVRRTAGGRQRTQAARKVARAVRAVVEMYVGGGVQQICAGDRAWRSGCRSGEGSSKVTPAYAVVAVQCARQRRKRAAHRRATAKLRAPIMRVELQARMICVAVICAAGVSAPYAYSYNAARCGKGSVAAARLRE